MAYIKKELRQWLLDGISGTIKDHAARLGVNYSRARYILQARPKMVREKKRKVSYFDIPKTCAHCSKEFLPKSSQHKWCSKACYYPPKPPRPVKVTPPRLPAYCFICRCELSPPRRRFCGRKCSNRHEQILQRKNPPPGWDMIHEPANCMCGAPLPVPRYFQRKKCKKCQKKGYPEYRKKRRARMDARRRLLPHHRIKERLSSRLREMCLRQGTQKTNGVASYLGCTPKELVAHIESRFLPGMSWQNYGVFGWHIDHHIPCASFDLSKEEHIRVCFHFSNLRPLWAMENALKADTLHNDIPQHLKGMALSVGVLIL